jgi:hypothetical protein
MRANFVCVRQYFRPDCSAQKINGISGKKYKPHLCIIKLIISFSLVILPDIIIFDITFISFIFFEIRIINLLVSFRKTHMDRQKTGSVGSTIPDADTGGDARQDGIRPVRRYARKDDRYNQALLGTLVTDGFNEARQGVMMRGDTWDRDVIVLVHAHAIREAFPILGSNDQYISFAERNLDPLRGLVNHKLACGKTRDFGVGGGRRRTGYLVEIDTEDLARSRRWLAP